MWTNESRLIAITKRFVGPFYSSLLNGNLMRWSEEPHKPRQLAPIGKAARKISDADLKLLFAQSEWRGRLTAAWFAGLTKRAKFVDTIGPLLLESELVYAGQGYCLAMGLIGGPKCEEYLCSYLKKYLPARGRVYNQTWAIGALAYLRGARPEEFLKPLLWEESSRNMDPEHGIKDFAGLISFLEKNRLIGAQPGRFSWRPLRYFNR